jgi:hypothetical protein
LILLAHQVQKKSIILANAAFKSHQDTGRDGNEHAIVVVAQKHNIF